VRRRAPALPRAATGKRYTTVLTTTLRYARYALAAVASVGFGLGIN
jgi:hypothetical protein